TKPVDLNQIDIASVLNFDPKKYTAPIPSSFTGGPSGGGVSSTGPFNYKLTYVYEGGLESNASAAKALKGDANGVKFDFQPVPGATYVSRILYREVVPQNGPSIY